MSREKTITSQNRIAGSYLTGLSVMLAALPVKRQFDSIEHESRDVIRIVQEPYRNETPQSQSGVEAPGASVVWFLKGGAETSLEECEVLGYVNCRRLYFQSHRVQASIVRDSDRNRYLAALVRSGTGFMTVGLYTFSLEASSAVTRRSLAQEGGEDWPHASESFASKQVQTPHPGGFGRTCSEVHSVKSAVVLIGGESWLTLDIVCVDPRDEDISHGTLYAVRYGIESGEWSISEPVDVDRSAFAVLSVDEQNRKRLREWETIIGEDLNRGLRRRMALQNEERAQ